MKRAVAIAAIAAGLLPDAACAAGAKVLASIDLPARSVDGLPVSEVSGLGWDQAGQTLFAVSDNGYLHRFNISVDHDTLSVEAPATVSISDPNVGLLTWSLSDAEGLHVHKDQRGQSELLIAFEDGPAIARFSLEGKYVADVALPAPLNDPSAYPSSNKRLESVSELDSVGVITAPEESVAGDPPGQHSIFSMDGRRWYFSALQETQSAVKALDPLPDGRVLVLERTRGNKQDQAHLRIVTLAGCTTGTTCRVEDVQVSDPEALALDFEGMTELDDGLLLLATDSPKGGVLTLLRLDLKG